MVNDHVAEDATLAAVLHRYAQHAPPRQLGAEIGGGITLAIIAALLRPGMWIVMASVGAAIAMLGVWSYADRAVEQAAFDAETRGWRTLRAVAALLGVCSALLTAFAFLARMLGTWIS